VSLRSSSHPSPQPYCHSDPSVAGRVQSLDLQLNLAEKHSLAVLSVAPRRKLQTWIAALFPHRRSPSPSRRSEALLARLAAVLPLMTNLQAFTAKVWNWPIKDLNHFLTMAWSSFRRNLRKLSLGGSLDAFLVLPPSDTLFDSLRELDLEFTSNPHPGAAAGDARVLVENIVPFVNNLAPQLLVLRVWSIALADLSPFFKHLALFPLLETFAIRAPFNRSFLEDPSGLTQLLHNSSTTLKAVQLRLNPSGFHHSTSDERLSAWLLHTFANDTSLASDLHTLQLYPSSFDAGIDTLILCLERSSQSLKKVTVYDRYLAHPDVCRIVAALPSQLVYLRLNIFGLSSTILDLLAKCLPNLTDLTLHIGGIIPDYLHVSPGQLCSTFTC